MRAPVERIFATYLIETPLEVEKAAASLAGEPSLLGIEFPAYPVLWRLAGVDQLHVYGIGNKFWESDDSVVRAMEACAKPLWSNASHRAEDSPLSAQAGRGTGRGVQDISKTLASSPRPSLLLWGEEREKTAGAPVLPVVSPGQGDGQDCETYRRTRTVDLLYKAGGGIMAHPDGPAARVRSLQKWWDAAAARCPELQKSVEKFGGERAMTI